MSNDITTVYTIPCFQCNEPIVSYDVYRCAHCNSVYYCSPRCQDINWPQHKDPCRRLLALDYVINSDIDYVFSNERSANFIRALHELWDPWQVGNIHCTITRRCYQVGMMRTTFAVNCQFKYVNAPNTVDKTKRVVNGTYIYDGGCKDFRRIFDAQGASMAYVKFCKKNIPDISTMSYVAIDILPQRITLVVDLNHYPL